MAFSTRSLRLLSNIYYGNFCNTSYSTLNKSFMKLNIISSSQKLYFHSSDNKYFRPKTSDPLTNIPSSPIDKYNSNDNDNDDDNLNNKKTQQEEDEERNKQRENSLKTLKWSFIFFGCAATIGSSMFIYELVKPVYDDNGNLVEDEFSHLPLYKKIWKRLCRELKYYKKIIEEPSRDKLLPDRPGWPYIVPRYTLVLEFTDLLVHPDWTYQTGWRFKKRPGVNQFLKALSNYEVVMYTADTGMSADPVTDSLDKDKSIHYRLYRDATRFIDGHHIKDLDALNRDLSKTIVVDWNSDSVKLHPQNLFKIERWNGNDDDRTLYDLAAFLNMISTSNVDDVRSVLGYYQQFDNPLEVFRENQLKLLQQMQDEEIQKQQMKHSKSLLSRWTSSLTKSNTS